MGEAATHVGILYVELFIGEAQSLKEKRKVLKSLKDRIRSQFNVSVAELRGQEKWQVATLGFAMIGTDNRYMDRVLQNILSFIDRCHAVEICGHDMEFC